MHFSKIEGEGFRVLRDGANVEYDAVLQNKGWHATRVVRLDGPGEDDRRHAHARTPRR